MLEYELSRINLLISINHLLFRAKLSDLSNEKREAIVREATDLESVLETLSGQNTKIENLYRENNNLRIEVLRLKKELVDLQQKELEI